MSMLNIVLKDIMFFTDIFHFVLIEDDTGSPALWFSSDKR